jgi:hypothetical protein
MTLLGLGGGGSSFVSGLSGAPPGPASAAMLRCEEGPF